LLRYSTFSILCSSSLGVRLQLEVVFGLRICKIWFGHLSLSLNFEYDRISGSWDIQLCSLLFCHFQCRWLGGYVPELMWDVPELMWEVPELMWRLSDNSTTSWPILQAETCKNFRQAEIPRWAECGKIFRIQNLWTDISFQTDMEFCRIILQE
jgi:hypothetical protein